MFKNPNLVCVNQLHASFSLAQPFYDQGPPNSVRTCSHCSPCSTISKKMNCSHCSSFALFAQCELFARFELLALFARFELFALFKRFTRFAVRYFRKKLLSAVRTVRSAFVRSSMVPSLQKAFWLQLKVDFHDI